MTIESFCQTLETELVHCRSCEERVELTERLLEGLSQKVGDCCGPWGCSSEKYARHLVYQGKNSGCCVVAMAWAPGQGTPVHDHDGTWCVECCLEGRLEIVRYELQEKIRVGDETQYLFEPVESERVGRGAVGALIPPYEHHVIRNPFEERAVTLHVYGKELKQSSCFMPVQGNRYRRVQKPLAYSEA